MNTKFNKIAKTAAIGIFFMALFLNVKLSLTDPFINIDNAAIAQTSSSSSGNGNFVWGYQLMWEPCSQWWNMYGRMCRYTGSGWCQNSAQNPCPGPFDQFPV